MEKLENQGGKFRKKRSNFSMIPNEIIRDADLSLKAKGLYTLIQSYITLDDFVVYKGFLLSKCAEGKKAFDSAWKELKDAGYLVQYRMQDEKKHFYYEYDLLDAPIPQKGTTDDIYPIPQKGYAPKGVTPKKDNIPNGGHINNTKHINTSENNTIRIISIEDVKRQIDYDPIVDDGITDNIVSIVADVLNVSDDESIKVNQIPISAIQVKERFRQVKRRHVDYIRFILSEFTGDIRNIRSFMITTIYNSVATCDLYFKTRVQHDLFNYAP